MLLHEDRVTSHAAIAQDWNQTLPVTTSLTGLSAQDHLGISILFVPFG